MSRPPENRMPDTPTIAGDLLVSTALLFGAALLVGVVAGILVLPTLQSPVSATLFLVLLLAADLAILFAFLRYNLNRAVLAPLDAIGAHAERIAAGDYEHPIPLTERAELDRMVESVNTMARRLIRDQQLLEENVRSLDTTNRELVETSAELVRTARMASVGTLAGGIAHELGNPLGALRTSLDVARRRLESGGDALEALEVAREEALRIDAIIRSILEFVRPAGEGGGWQSAPPEELVRGAVQLLERRGVLEGIPFEIRSEGHPPDALVRTQLIEQVLINLLVNAAQAVGHGEGAVGTGGAEPATAHPATAHPLIEVLVRPGDSAASTPVRRRGDDPPGTDYSHRRRVSDLHETVPIPAELRGDAGVIIEIRDRGPGIAESHLDRIFDPFFTTREPGEGTGMGLAITARIVEELGATLEASNHPEGGALFRLTLPGARPGAAVPSSSQPNAHPEPAHEA
jgi:two-component system, NtrC family, sensor kinase